MTNLTSLALFGLAATAALSSPSRAGPRVRRHERSQDSAVRTAVVTLISCV
ncbi:hypothetical protein [Streptomyces indiaensis]|uniref:hypothetical protein n=1 Tax=Streptomyces indiaensis TaxID=284033 RepID=UPI001F194D13|nr:hypothetical protein [Streptomyces indiaensis]MCF1646054.1 hypothetical protein [Streptomyces indiaensis]